MGNTSDKNMILNGYDNADRQIDETKEEAPISHTEGKDTRANDYCSHAEGAYTEANAPYAHSEGQFTKANGEASHAEGEGTIAIDAASHTEGHQTMSDGFASHAEGGETQAIGPRSHAEGFCTIAKGPRAHAEGDHTKATGPDSHAEGQGTVAKNEYEHAEGKYNVSHRGEIDNPKTNTIHSIGIGENKKQRRNAVEVMRNGDMYVFGIGDYQGDGLDKARTLQEVIKTQAKFIEELMRSNTLLTADVRLLNDRLNALEGK